ncbi:class IV adenylate cyclase [Candidatus Thorarchaeota archaeon]|nr:MAG: class IV adenylate cyclase [Candidatus Thorarchaeota archaeon]
MKEPYEVEVKLPVTDKEAMKQKIIQAGGVPLNSDLQIDTYYDHPCRSFSKTDESIRIRHRTLTEGSPLNESEHAPIELTYKGPKVDKKTKTRIEYTVGLEEKDHASITKILSSTGFRFVAIITKTREFFDIGGIVASLDDVNDVGLYIELELIAKGEDGMKAAREQILELVKNLGLDENTMVRESYLELYLNTVRC